MTGSGISRESWSGMAEDRTLQGMTCLLCLIVLGSAAVGKEDAVVTTRSVSDLPSLTYVYVRGEIISCGDIPRDAALEVAAFLNMLTKTGRLYGEALYGPWEDVKPYPYPVERSPDTGALFCHIVLGDDASAFFKICLRSRNRDIHFFMMKTAWQWYYWGRHSEPGAPRTAELIRKYGYDKAAWEPIMPLLVENLQDLDDHLRELFWLAVWENFRVWHGWPELFDDPDRYDDKLLDLLWEAAGLEQNPRVRQAAESTLRLIGEDTGHQFKPLPPLKPAPATSPASE